MAPRTSQGLQERAWYAPTKGLEWERKGGRVVAAGSARATKIPSRNSLSPSPFLSLSLSLSPSLFHHLLLALSKSTSLPPQGTGQIMSALTSLSSGSPGVLPVLSQSHLPSEKGTTETVFRNFTGNTRPQSGLDCLICATFARQRTLIHEAHRLLYHSTLGWRVIQREERESCCRDGEGPERPAESWSRCPSHTFSALPPVPCSVRNSHALALPEMLCQECPRVSSARNVSASTVLYAPHALESGAHNFSWRIFAVGPRIPPPLVHTSLSMLYTYI